MMHETESVHIRIRDLIVGEEGELLEELCGEKELEKISDDFEEIKFRIEGTGLEVTDLVRDNRVTTWSVHKPNARPMFDFKFSLWSVNKSGEVYVPVHQIGEYRKVLGKNP